MPALPVPAQPWAAHRTSSKTRARGETSTNSSIAAAARGCARPEALARDARAAGRELKGDSTTLILRSPTCGEAACCTAGAGRRGALAVLAPLFRDGPFRAAAGEAGHHAARLRAGQELERSPFYTDYLVQWDSIYHLGVDVREEGRYYARLRVAVHGAPVISRPPIAKWSHGWCPISTTPFVRGPRSSRPARVAQLTPRRWTTELATLILDATGRVIHANARARELLASPTAYARRATA